MDPRSVTLATRLLRRMDAGESAAEEELYGLLWSELHDRARGFMRDQGPEHTLQATALVNEVWLRLARAGSSGWESRRHFLAVATRAMRSVLVDHARARSAQKRSGDRRRVEIDEATPDAPEAPGGADSASRIVALDEALERLAAEDPDSARVAEMRLFGGLEHADVARALDVSTRTVERAWKRARERLRAALDP